MHYTTNGTVPSATVGTLYTGSIPIRGTTVVRAMAYADDGLVEAFFDPQSAFTVGIQFHPERMLSEYEGNLRVWQAFARAVHQHSRLHA